MSEIAPNQEKTVIFITGPTAVGKTALAIRLATALNTRIISADSRQCYQELSIGVAKPSAAELAAVHHYFINSHAIGDVVDAALFEAYAMEALTHMFKTSHVAVVVGGTGLYIKALSEGVDEMPPVDPAIREAVREGFHREGLGYVHQRLQQEDPDFFYATHERQNPHRMLRALEFVLSTGISISKFQKSQPKPRPFNIIKIGLELPKEDLHQRIDLRTDMMMEQGLLAEVQALQAHSHLNALQTVGYREIFEHLEGRSSLEAAVEFIKRHTRQYAKRQLTWFKKDNGITWFSPNDTDAIEHWIYSRFEGQGSRS